MSVSYDPDFDSERMALAKEQAFLFGDEREPQPMALCLSGGGIRSATFCLGVLQGLARIGMLRHFHYLSSVSGGGYIGAWLSSWIHRSGFDQVMQELAQPKDGAAEPPEVQKLRAYSNYLSPSWGLSTDFLTLVATALRNMLLNWTVFLPILFAVLMAPRLVVAVTVMSPGRAAVWAVAVASVLLVAVSIAYITADLPGKQLRGKPPRDRFNLLCFLPLLVAAMGLSLVMAWDPQFVNGLGLGICVLAGIGVHVVGLALGVFWRASRGLALRAGSSGLPWLPVLAVAGSGSAGGALLWLAGPAGAGADKLLYVTLSVPALLAAFWMGMTVQVGLARRFTQEGDREWWARASARWLGAGAVWLAACVLVLYLPQWTLAALQKLGVGAGSAGAAAILTGVVTSAAGYWSRNGATLKKRATTFIAVTGTRLLDLCAGIFIIALAIAICLSTSFVLGLLLPVQSPPEFGVWSPKQYGQVLTDVPAAFILAAMAGLALLAWLMSSLVGTNTFSLHAMYGNRLTRAYLGATRQQRSPHWFTGFDSEDNLNLKDLAQGPHRRLFHVINAALNLVGPAGGRREWQQRKAASFTFTPLHCGSPFLGYVRTPAYGSSEGASLALAMTVSGAAASPNMGYHSSPLVAFVMTLFNVRLGWWLPNPNPRWRDHWQRMEPQSTVGPMLDEALGQATAAKASVHLSDGGHFDNLGLYEMVRRRCPRILVVDASCDGASHFGDLEDTIRKIRVDLGISIEFPDGLTGNRTGQSAGRRTVLGVVRYGAVDGGPDGTLIYMKPVVLGNEPLDVLRYAASNAKPDSSFPHQSTADQFFNEAQFESYRMLGLHSVLDTLAPDHWPRSDQDLDSRIPCTLVPPYMTQGFRGGGVAPAPPVSTAAGEGLFADAARAAGAIGQQAMLAAAVTVGGAVGVTGAVALNNKPELTIRAQDVELLKGGLQVGLSEETRGVLARPIELAAADRIALTQATGELTRLSEALARRGAAGEVTVALTALTSTVNNMVNTQVRRQDVTELHNTLEKVRVAVQRTPPALQLDLQPVTQKLEVINDTLGQTLKAVERVEGAAKDSNPRRNTRATGESR